MYFWRCVCALVLGLVWYFSESEYFVLQVGCCALCFLMDFLGGGNNKVCESSTQTDCPADEAISQQEGETGHIVGSDVPDSAVQNVQKASRQSQYPNIQRSLQHLFKCAYTHLVLPWSTPPELGDSQPLHTALLTEFNSVMDEIICKAKDLDLPVTALGCIQIFTRHLQNTKQSEGSPAFSSKAEEIAVIREFCKALIHTLFPEHLWEPNVYYCALQEILVMKALAFVTLLSDPDSLNQLIVSQLDQMSAENLMEEVRGTDTDVPSSKWCESSDVWQGEAEDHPFEEGKAKKKGNKLKAKLSKVLNSIKRKKAKLKRKEKDIIEKAVSFRRPAVMEGDGTSSNEGSVCDSDDNDGESLTGSLQKDIMEFKLSYEMWRVGNWAVTVTNVQMERKELCFTVHLEEISNPENLHWDVKKNQSDIIQFYNQFKETGHLSSLLAIVEKPKTEWNKEEAREILEQSLKDLMLNPELGDSELVFEFLGPIDRILHEEEHDDEGLWVLLGGIASFLTPGQDDDELSNLKGDEKQHEVMYECNASDATPQHELDATQPVCTDTLERQDKETEDESLVADGGHLPTPEQTSPCMTEEQPTDYTAPPSDLPDGIPVGIQSVGVNITQFAAKMKYPKFEHNVKRHASAFSSSERDEDSSIHCTTDGVSVCNYNGKEENLPHRKSSETGKPEKKEEESHPEVEILSQPTGEKKMSNSWEQPEANKVIFDLLKEISGNSYTFKLMKAVVTPFSPLINKKVNAFLKKMNPSEAQIATYIDSLCENIWPDGAAPQPPTQSSDNKNETKQKAMQIMTSKFAGFAIISKTNVESIFKIFQNAEENKKLVYMLLRYLLREFLHTELGFPS
ncbi:uncharacterized protein si:rp71-46j2.7 isoform X1 [Pangasianodon hypophthalmus]|uniref:uncharacterized protein si:rp71-46j2.7 isoform X1 n=1 Tax=Pangasianodon hypophthalmus TaxID=310915 RepID=UPI0023076F70|nr:uncharacterized protein si:rp71-46j2.7 isoform X1 [Pangasianodon hypophthalmus]